MGVGNEVHGSMKVYNTKCTRQFSHSQSKNSNQRLTYFGWSGVRFGRAGEAGSAGAEVAAAAAVVVLDAAGGLTAAVAAAVELPAVAVGISAAAAAE